MIYIGINKVLQITKITINFTNDVYVIRLSLQINFFKYIME